MKEFDVTKDYNRENFVEFLTDFLPEDFEQEEEQTYFDYINIEEGYKLGTSASLDLDIYEFRTKSKRDPKVTLTREVVSCMNKYSSNQNAIVAFYSNESHHWRLSLITTDFIIENGKVKKEHSNPRRFSFKLGKDCKKHTPESMLSKPVTSLKDLKSRFDIEVVTKEFYNELFAWYTWACENVTFPKGDTTKDKNNKFNVKQTKDNNELNLIRLITRLMFVWFIKQKGLVPSWIFDQAELNKVLVEFNPESKKEGNYYNAILQNLFFATLNKKIEERAFADDKNVLYNKQFGVKNYYRDDNKNTFFAESYEKIIERFKPVPFLNGGLFECLDKLVDDKESKKNIEVFTDGFSREKEWMAFIPNILFWHKEDGVHEGLIPLLNRYNFTVEENSPTDVQVALDPELLGKVFENLLGTYNPETSETARKDSGSFYTPRQIVSFMIDESIKNYLSKSVKSISNDDLQNLFDDSIDYYENDNKTRIIDSLKKIKVLDPACGSGAFPMGALQRIVHLIRKCGGITQNQTAIYTLKLELIENCLYGVDIQPIAVQICKLRFFISLICEQEKTDSVKDNYGFNPLPNLETKFVAANSLIGIKKDEQFVQGILFPNEELDKTKLKLQNERHRHFTAPTAEAKAECRKHDKELREKLAVILQKDQMYDNEDAKQLASWNPYDQNAVSSFFDAEWMFNITNGFDIVIGNPPYISTKGVSSEDKKKYETEFGFSDDTYNLFTFKGLELTRNNGTLTYIIPKTFWTTQTKRNMRDLILGKNIKYIFDTANPFDAVMVDTCIIQIENSKYNGTNEIAFLDGTEDLKKPKYFEPIKQDVYLKTQNSVIFKPTERNLKIWNLYGEKVKDLYNTWWEKIETSKKISQNEYELQRYRESLQPGDVALLGCLTEGGQGLATANNGKYIAVRKSSKWADNILTSRPKKLAQAIEDNPKIAKELGNIDVNEYLDKLSEEKIAKLFDDLKEKYGRDIFGQGYIYKLIDDSEIADVDSLTEDEKTNGISTKKPYYVPYDKGDKDGNRWYLETPFAIAWSKENVQFLKTDPKARYQGYAFFFKEGFCWNLINGTRSENDLKFKYSEPCVNDVGGMTLHSYCNKISAKYIICIGNSDFASRYTETFVNFTVNFQVNDCRQIPLIIPTEKQLEDFEKLFDEAYLIKRKQYSCNATNIEFEEKLNNIQVRLNKMVNELYRI